MQHQTPPAAQSFVDFWQDHMRRFIQDERYLAGMLDLLTQMQQNTSPIPGKASETSVRHDRTAPHASASPGASDAEPGQPALVNERLRLCEQRIAELERQVESLRRV